MVAKTGNISHAANALFISQPAISKSISKLEEGLNIKLFSRNSKGVELTDEGVVLYEHIKSAFDYIKKGEEEIKRINDLGIGQLKIGVSTSLCKHILLDYLKDFIDNNPHIKVIIDCHSTVNTIKLLQEGKIDIGLICSTDIPSGFVYKPVEEIHDIFVASKSYIENLSLRENEDFDFIKDPRFFVGNLTPLLEQISNDNELNSVLSKNNYSDGQYSLSTKDILEKSNLMLLETNNITRTHIDHYLSANGIYPNQILEINSMDLLIDFASIGMGVASVVREFATAYLENESIIELKLDKPIEKRTVGFVFPDGKTKSTALSKFMSFCNI